MLPNISRSKGNQLMAIDQFIEHNKRNIFLEIHEQNEADRLVSDLFLIFKRILYQLKASGCQLIFHIFRQSSSWHVIKANCIKLQTLDPKICSILIFKKSIQEYFLHHILCMIFLEKCFSFYILGNMCITFVYFPGCDVINFEINLIFPIKPLFYMSDKSSDENIIS